MKGNALISAALLAVLASSFSSVQAATSNASNANSSPNSPVSAISVRNVPHKGSNPRNTQALLQRQRIVSTNRTSTSGQMTASSDTVTISTVDVSGTAVAVTGFVINAAGIKTPFDLTGTLGRGYLPGQVIGSVHDSTGNFHRTSL